MRFYKFKKYRTYKDEVYHSISLPVHLNHWADKTVIIEETENGLLIKESGAVIQV